MIMDPMLRIAIEWGHMGDVKKVPWHGAIEMLHLVVSSIYPEAYDRDVVITSKDLDPNQHGRFMGIVQSMSAFCLCLCCYPSDKEI